MWWEKRAEDPVIDIYYFATKDVGVVLLLGAVSGLILMCLVFVPQFAENSMRLETGSGSYPVIILGLASGVGAPLSGTLTDKIGARSVVAIGAVGSLLAAFRRYDARSDDPCLVAG